MTLARPFNIFMACVFLTVSGATPARGAEELPMGPKAPYFSVVSGDGKTLTSRMLIGKVAVIFYETKDTVERNRALKTALNEFYSAQSPAAQKTIERIAIIRCSGFFPNVWRRNLREHSKKEGIVIYGDWDDSMYNNYGMAEDESNFLIIDKDGCLRYIRGGVIPQEKFSRIKADIASLNR